MDTPPCLLPLIYSLRKGTLVAQEVKRWPIDPVVMGLSHALGRDLVSRKFGSIAYSLSLSPTYCPDMTEKNVEKDVKSQVMYPS